MKVSVNTKAVAIVIVAIISLYGISMAVMKSEPKVPEVVKKAFSAKYPKAQKVEWEAEGVGEYEAEFKLKRKEMSANFKADGTWLVSELEIKESDLPSVVKIAIESEFPGYEVEKAEQLEKPELPVAYEVQLENDELDTELEVVFKADGTVIEKKTKEEEEEEK